MEVSYLLPDLRREHHLELLDLKRDLGPLDGGSELHVVQCDEEGTVIRLIGPKRLQAEFAVLVMRFSGEPIDQKANLKLV